MSCVSQRRVILSIASFPRLLSGTTQWGEPKYAFNLLQRAPAFSCVALPAFSRLLVQPPLERCSIIHTLATTRRRPPRLAYPPLRIQSSAARPWRLLLPLQPSHSILGCSPVASLHVARPWRRSTLPACGVAPAPPTLASQSPSPRRVQCRP